MSKDPIWMVTYDIESRTYYGHPVEGDRRQLLKDLKRRARLFGGELKFVALRRASELVDFAEQRRILIDCSAPPQSCIALEKEPALPSG